MEIARRLVVLGLNGVLHEYRAGMPIIEHEGLSVEGWTRICYGTKERDLNKLSVRHSHYYESDRLVNVAVAFDQLANVVWTAARRYKVGTGYYVVTWPVAKTGLDNLLTEESTSS
jgi:hypothetical protein